MKNIREDEFLKKYERKLRKVSMQNSTIKTLMYFLDLEYWCFTFENIDMCLTLEEYSLLTEFPQNLYKVYFHQIHDKMLTELVELIKVPNLYKILEKNTTSLKWKWSKKYSKGGIINLKAAATFIAYENTDKSLLLFHVIQGIIKNIL
jgi:hypothetical protein